MKYDISFSQNAERQLDQFTAREQRIILASIRENLTHNAETATRNRKPLRENHLASWELRVRSFRVFYNIVDGEVSIIALGVKEGNKVIIEGEVHEL